MEPTTFPQPNLHSNLRRLAWVGAGLSIGIVAVWVGAAAYLAMKPDPARFEPLPHTVTWDFVR